MLFLGLLLPATAITASAAPGTSIPAGVPKNAVRATVTGSVNGDTIKVSLNKHGETVRLAGIDAPAGNECFGDAASAYVGDLLPKPTTVYLEATSADHDADGRLLRYVWVPGDGNAKAYLLNTKLVREGYAAYSDRLDEGKYASRLQDQTDDARDHGRGAWGECGGMDEPLAVETPAPVVQTPQPVAQTPAPAPATWSADEQAYLDWLMSENALLKQSMDQLTELTGNFQTSDLFDQDWIIGMAVVAVTWQLSYDNAVAYSPPPAFANVHALWIQATAHYANAADYLIYGVDHYDAASLEAAATEIELGTQGVAQVTAALDSVTPGGA